MATVKINAFKELYLICWNLDRDNIAITEQEAFNLYETNWKYINPSAFDQEEKIFVEHLIITYGKGIMNV